MAITPLQDVLGLGSEARMNRPGTAQGNWEWRYAAEMLTDEVACRLCQLTEIYGRMAVEDQR
jgi:4-alpha-glucanotransferase